jgi:ATP-dependent helicase HrpA
MRDTVTEWDFGALPASVEVAGTRAYPALSVEQERIALRLFESHESATREHTAGVKALLLARAGERLRDLARTARSRLGIALTQTGLTAEALARQVAERAAEGYWNPAAIRDQQAFAASLERRAEFGHEAARRLEDVCGWLNAAMDLRKRRAGVEKAWPQAAADLRGQLQQLFAPGFVAAIPEEVWPRIPVYLRAAAIRLDRLPHKPQRDLDATRQIGALSSRLPGPFHPARWLLEEWRIALFAQELRANGSPTAAKIAAAIES